MALNKSNLYKSFCKEVKGSLLIWDTSKKELYGNQDSANSGCF